MFNQFQIQVTESQNRVVLLLDRPVTSRSLIHVYVDKAGKVINQSINQLNHPFPSPLLTH